MRKSFVLDLTCVLLLAASALAQRGGVGGLPQQVRKGMETAMQRLENKQFMTTLESLEQSIGPEEVAGFLEGAVVRLALYPDGSFAAYSIEGGEVVSFSLGKQKVAIAPGPVKKENLLKQTGKFSAPRRPQDLGHLLVCVPLPLHRSSFSGGLRYTESLNYQVVQFSGIGSAAEGAVEDHESVRAASRRS